MSNLESGDEEILLVGNYPPDGQESMLRYGRMLLSGLRSRGCAVDLVAPSQWFGGHGWRGGGFSKWLAYANKYLIFPWVLRWRVRRLGGGGVVHIMDHSNAVYVPSARSAGHPVVVTCHDLGAVRGALGEDTNCPATRTGKWLQRWIAASLGKADEIVCVSEATRGDVQRLIRRRDGRPVRVSVASLGLNAPFGRLEAGAARARLRGAARRGFDPDAPFVLNVGSSLSRKNRDGVLRIFAQVVGRWPEGRLVFAGEAMTAAENRLAGDLGLAERVTEFAGPSDAELEALYNAALCLLFPSKFEGFGWPAVEAQACGCPVLSSDAGALAEVVGEGGFVRPYTDETGFAAEILRLAHNDDARANWQAAGTRNAERFSTDQMLNEYAQTYARVTGAALAEEALAR